MLLFGGAETPAGRLIFADQQGSDLPGTKKFSPYTPIKELCR